MGAGAATQGRPYKKAGCMCVGADKVNCPNGAREGGLGHVLIGPNPGFCGPLGTAAPTTENRLLQTPQSANGRENGRTVLLPRVQMLE